MPQLNKALIQRIVKTRYVPDFNIEGICYPYMQELANSKDARTDFNAAIRLISEQKETLEVRNIPEKILISIQRTIENNKSSRLKYLTIYDKLGHAYEDLSSQVEPIIWYSSIDGVNEALERLISPAASPELPVTLTRIPSITRAMSDSSIMSPLSPMSPISPIASANAEAAFSPDPSPTNSVMSSIDALYLGTLEQEAAKCEEELRTAKKNHSDRKATYDFVDNATHNFFAQILLNRLIPARSQFNMPPVGAVKSDVEDDNFWDHLEESYPDVEAPAFLPVPAISPVEETHPDAEVLTLLPESSLLGDRQESSAPVVIVKQPPPPHVKIKKDYEDIYNFKSGNLDIKRDILRAAQTVLDDKQKLLQIAKENVEHYKNSLTNTVLQRPRFFNAAPSLCPRPTPQRDVPKFIL